MGNKPTASVIQGGTDDNIEEVGGSKRNFNNCYGHKESLLLAVLKLSLQLINLYIMELHFEFVA